MVWRRALVSVLALAGAGVAGAASSGLPLLVALLPLGGHVVAAILLAVLGGGGAALVALAVRSYRRGRAYYGRQM